MSDGSGVASAYLQATFTSELPSNAEITKKLKMCGRVLKHCADLQTCSSALMALNNLCHV